MSTKITWTDEVWNPVTGCSKVSQGCKHCYAERMSKRLAGRLGYPADNPFKVTLHPDRLELPLRWRKPRRIFVNSMSDLFHPDVPDSFIVKAFAVMAVARQHTFQMLTKRPERMARLLGDTVFRALVAREILDLAPAGKWAIYDPRTDRGWPLGNVHLGVSAEDQQTFDLRVGVLVQVPAVVRFVSMEPLLGPIDPSPWLPVKAPMLPEEAPATWAEFSWPDWVPAEVRRQVEEFWPDAGHRGPREWIRDMYIQHSHPFGAVIQGEDGYQVGAPMTTGRWVHCWNNIGRIVHEDGSFSYSAFYARQQPPIHWIIVGGESGPGARPMHPDWARQVRDACKAAGVSFLFKQNGEWAATDLDPAEAYQRTRTDPRWRHLNLAGGQGFHGERVVVMHRVGKKGSGRLLDGRTWDEYPGVRS